MSIDFGQGNCIDGELMFPLITDVQIIHQLGVATRQCNEVHLYTYFNIDKWSGCILFSTQITHTHDETIYKYLPLRFAHRIEYPLPPK